MHNDKPDWKNVLYFKEIKNYLSFRSLKDLSGCCNTLKSKLFSSSVKILNFTDFIKREDFQTFGIEDKRIKNVYSNLFDPHNDKIQDEVTRFKFDLENMACLVQKYSFNDQVNHFYSYKFFDIFNRITILQLSFSQIPLKLLQYMLSNLKLTQLTVESITVFNDKPEFRVTLPQSLIKIEYANCYSRLHKSDSAPIEILQPEYSETLPVFFLEPQYISSLRSLTYTSLTVDSSNFDKFLALNPQLKSITAWSDSLSWKNLQILHFNNQIEHLKIIHYPLTQFSDFQCPMLTSLKSLTTFVYYDTDHFFNIIPSCPDLIRLNLTFETIYDVYNAIRFASNMKKLKHFSLRLHGIQKLDSLIDFPIMEQLEILEFNEFNPEGFDWNQLAMFPKLKMVKFYGKYAKISKKPFQSKIENIEKWKAMYYSDSIVYYKA